MRQRRNNNKAGTPQENEGTKPNGQGQDGQESVEICQQAPIKAGQSLTIQVLNQQIRASVILAEDRRLIVQYSPYRNGQVRLELFRRESGWMTKENHPATIA